MNLLQHINRKLTHLRLRPVNVYCLHHVCQHFDKNCMGACDYTDISAFKQKIIAMRNNGICFIPLSKYIYIYIYDLLRLKKYAILTFDDGYASLKEILPWLVEQQIPCTLFVSGKYLDGVSYRNNPNESYLTERELRYLADRSNGLITIAHHGWEHTDATKMTQAEFEESLQKNISLLSTIPNYIPFWAYTWGRHNDSTDELLRKNSIVPVLMDGMKNYNDKHYIHREILI